MILCRAGTESWELVTLTEVGEVKGRLVFVPWSSVSWMRPTIPEDLEASETG